MKKTLQICLSAALLMAGIPSLAQTVEEAAAALARGDNLAGLEMYRKLADQGNAVAQFNIAYFNERGRFGPANYDAAEFWYYKSAQQGNVKAQSNLAWFYVDIKKDDVRAAFWYEKAAAQKDAKAIASLSNLYAAHPGLKETVRKHLDTEIDINKQQALAQQQGKDLDAQDEQSKKESLACLDKLYDDPRAKSLSGKIMLDTRKPAPMELLANTAKPTAKEKTALSYIVAEWERCVDMQAETHKRKLSAETMQAMNAYRLDLRSAFADLYSGKFSYGDLAKARARLDLEFSQKISAIIAAGQAREMAEAKQRQEAEAQRRYAEAQNQQQREAELQRQQEARRQQDMLEAQMRQQQAQARQLQKEADFNRTMQMLQMFSQPQQVQQAPPLLRPPVTCTSNRLGNTVTTNCN
ncbi:tetratricopeptide repeat protein [Undibacterium sp. TJN19]|uniref:tetratricopeptide repeat protein n=1 Tax=Undibacterium sp. TJN19 TaxID=3413055 RepID=UPI003BF08D59